MQLKSLLTIFSLIFFSNLFSAEYTINPQLLTNKEVAEISTSEIPQDEYDCLVKMYKSTLGSEWTNNTNWLDTVNSTVNDWYGVTVENGHITEIQLPNNNLQDSIFISELLLPELKTLDISENYLTYANFSYLDSLSELTELHIQNNNFIFTHIIQISNLTSYSNFSNNFTYSPQKKIDTEKLITINEGEVAEFDIDTKWISEDDIFQWYKDSIELEGKTNYYMDIWPVALSDSGNYYLQITNSKIPELTLQSQNQTLAVKKNENDIERVPNYEYETLVNIYESTNGENWTDNTNWLDTINSSVSDWYGITVENGHVTEIQLPSNNLQDSIFFSELFLPELKTLNISGNKLTDANFSYLDSLPNLTELYIENNNFIFKHIIEIKNLTIYNNIASNFTYSPQGRIDNEENVSVDISSQYQFSIPEKFISENDLFQWYKDGEILEGETNSTLQFESVAFSDSGAYFIQITNPEVEDLILQSQYKILNPFYAIGKEVPMSEYEALVAFYDSTNGNNWYSNTNWLDTINFSVSEWDGITVENNHVTRIALDSNNVVGTLPTLLTKLTKLELLSLYNNGISGSLPSFLDSLTSLITLSLGKNNISGEIPSGVSHLDSLVYLELSYNSIEGIIPSEIGNLLKLEGLWLGHNDLEGEIPSEMGNLTKLRHLDLSDNSLTGTIPSEIGNLTNLRTLNLPNNSLTGPLPVELENLTELTLFDIGNNLIGKVSSEKSALLNSIETTDDNRQIPDELSALISMDTLHLEGNQLQFNDIEAIRFWDTYDNFKDFIYSPQDSIGTTTTLEKNINDSVTLTIDNYYPGEHDYYQWYKDNAYLEGENDSTFKIKVLKPSDAGAYHCKISNSKTTKLTLYSKKINLKVNKDSPTAGIPFSEYESLVALYNSTNGEQWNRNENWLDTINYIVDEWDGITVKDGHVTRIYLDSNNVDGIIPKAIGNLTYLEQLYLGFNNLSDTIPNAIGALTNLKILFLEENNLNGNIPKTVGNLESVTDILLDQNNLDGSIPEEIGNLQNLQYLYLDDNNINGQLPESIGDLNNLIALSLRNNSLTGTIPSSIGTLSNLQFLVLSGNQITGPLPAELANLPKLITFNIDDNLIGADTSTKSANLQNFTTDDNRQIPDELSELLLMDTLHLDGNQLQFNDIEAIFLWDNYLDFKSFIYSPQDSIGTEETLNALTEDSISLSIDNYFAGTSDQYQWYKNGKSISGKTTETLKLNSIELSDSGKYVCKITNAVATDLTLYSRPITLKISQNIKGAGIPLSEYETLVKIYNSTDGDNWKNNENWLDTINYSVSDWYGITVANNHVVGFTMPGNNLSKIPDALNNLSELKVIDISEGNFSDEIPSFENLSQLDTLDLANNKFIFSNLIPISEWENYNNFKNNFTYSPQAKIGEERSLFYSVDDTMQLSIESYETTDGDYFSWFRNDTKIAEGNSGEQEKIVTYDDNNTSYYCNITNPELPNLTLQSEPILINVTNSILDSILLIDLAQSYSELQEIWNYDTNVSEWTGVTFKNGKLTALDLSGLNLEGEISVYFASFDSLKWLNISNNSFNGTFANLFEESALKNSILSEESTLQYLNISSNKFIFSDLEPYISEFNSIDEFIYSPQEMIGNSLDTFIFKNQDFSFSINNYTAGDFDNYIWYQNDSIVSDGNSSIFTIENATIADSGKYNCKVTNSYFPELTLISDTIRLSVLIPSGVTSIKENDISIYPNPATSKVYINTGEKKVDLKVFNLLGELIMDKNNFYSNWVEIANFNPGVYLFKIETEDREIINKKIIFK